MSTDDERSIGLDDLISAAKCETEIDQSVIRLIEAISSHLDAAGNDPRKLLELRSIIDNNKAEIAIAITASEGPRALRTTIAAPDDGTKLRDHLQLELADAQNEPAM